MKILNLDSSPRGERPCKEAREWFSQNFPKGATVPQLIRACVILFPLMWTEHEPLSCWIGDLRKLLHDDVEFLHSWIPSISSFSSLPSGLVSRRYRPSI